MDEKFQDRIDNYLLDRMNDAERMDFLHEVEQDKEKWNQLEFTKHVKDSIRSREEKRRVLVQFQKRYYEERKATAMCVTGTEEACYCPAPKIEKRPLQSKKIWLCISGVALVFVVGFFAITSLIELSPSPDYEGLPMENMRGGDEVFSPVPADSTDNDSIGFQKEKEVTPDE